MMHGGMMGMMGMMGCMCPMMGGGPMGGATTKVDVKKVDKGVTITLTSPDAATPTRLQNMAEAMRLMTWTAFQEEREAAGKWTRARVSSAQLPSYFVGYQEHIALRRDAEKRAGGKFDLKAYHDQVTSYGSPPVRYVRAMMFDEKIA